MVNEELNYCSWVQWDYWLNERDSFCLFLVRERVSNDWSRARNILILQNCQQITFWAVPWNIFPLGESNRQGFTRKFSRTSKREKKEQDGFLWRVVRDNGFGRDRGLEFKLWKKGKDPVRDRSTGSGSLFESVAELFWIENVTHYILFFHENGLRFSIQRIHHWISGELRKMSIV